MLLSRGEESSQTPIQHTHQISQLYYARCNECRVSETKKVLMEMEMGVEKMKEDKDMLNLSIVSNIVSDNCRCNELEVRSKKAEKRCAELEFKLHKKKNQCEALEAKLKALEGELEVLRVSTEGLKEKKKLGNVKEREVETIDDLTDDNEVLQLMIENSVLECEKKRAESEVEVWKDKYRKLESLASQLNLKMESGSFYHEENGKKENNNWIRTDGSSHLEPTLYSKVLPVGKVRRQLTFEIEESPSKKMAPSTPVVAKSSSIVVIDIVDSDDEPNITQHPALDSDGSRSISVPSCFIAENEKMSSSYAQNNAEDLNFGEDLPFVATPKRKRNCNVVTSETEGDDDNDDMPICKFKRMHIQEVSADQVRCDTNSSVTASTSAGYKVTSTVTPRRRLMPLRKCTRKSQEGKKVCRSDKAKYQQSIPTNDDDDESEEDLSDCEDDGLSDFIVDDCDDTSSKSQDASTGDVDSDSSKSQDNDTGSDSRDVSNEEDMDFGKILSQIRRRKDHMEWEFEADMLAAFGKDSELCMKAVCVLYQRQTSEEQMSRGTLYYNQRGFNKFDAHRGSTLAEFLTHGDPRGGLKKSVKELQEYDPKAVELCRTLAIRYSKQLFEIYKNKEDPFFP